MREILFEGKRKDNGEWVYGNLITDDDDVYILAKENLSKGIDIGGWIDGAQSYEVIPETVGQYTGLCDKNGTRIFEGDILEGDLEDSLDPGARWRSIVVWGTFGWMCKDRQCLPMDTFDVLEGEVIGNIHDNPELLER